MFILHLKHPNDWFLREKKRCIFFVFKHPKLGCIHTYRVKICWLLTLTLTQVRPRARPRHWVIKYDSPEAEAESKNQKIWLTAQNWVIVLSHIYRPSHRFESNLSTESSNWVIMLDRVIEVSQIYRPSQRFY